MRRGELVIERAGHTVTMGRRQIHLTPTEFELLAYMASHAGRAIRHRELLVAVWGSAYEHDLHILQVTMQNLRAKLDPTDRSRFVTTLYGSGYRFGAGGGSYLTDRAQT